LVIDWFTGMFDFSFLEFYFLPISGLSLILEYRIHCLLAGFIQSSADAGGCTLVIGGWDSSTSGADLCLISYTLLIVLLCCPIDAVVYTVLGKNVTTFLLSDSSYYLYFSMSNLHTTGLSYRKFIKSEIFCSILKKCCLVFFVQLIPDFMLITSDY